MANKEIYEILDKLGMVDEVRAKDYNQHIIKQDITDAVKKFSDLEAEFQSDHWEDYWRDYYEGFASGDDVD